MFKKTLIMPKPLFYNISKPTTILARNYHYSSLFSLPTSKLSTNGRFESPAVTSLAYSNLTRQYATRSNVPRFHLIEYGLLSDFVPMPKSKRPSFYSSKLGFKIALQHWKNIMATTFAIGSIKRQIKNWSPNQFLIDGERMYDEMNVAFAKGDRETLQVLCQPVLLSKLKSDMKKRVGTYYYQKLSSLEKPRIVQAVTKKLGPDSFIFQVVLRITQEQAVAIYSSGSTSNSGRPSAGSRSKLIAGDPNKAIPVTEYIVFQNIVEKSEFSGNTVFSDRNINDGWKIYGKLQETKFFVPVANSSA